jgi:hypothetical protein
MIDELDNMPVNTVGFRAIDDVTKEDFENVVIPAVNRQVKEFGELNYEISTHLYGFVNAFIQIVINISI